LYDEPTLEEALMRPSLITAFAATLVFGAVGASAQNGNLGGVTMRVLDDVSDIDAVILELDANRADGEEGAERDGRREPSGDADAADANAAEPRDAAAEEDRLDERREREELHDPDDDERGEGRLEDRDVERPAVPPTP
jgi:hypothetical protein